MGKVFSKKKKIFSSKDLKEINEIIEYEEYDIISIEELLIEVFQEEKMFNKINYTVKSLTEDDINFDNRKDLELILWTLCECKDSYNYHECIEYIIKMGIGPDLEYSRGYILHYMCNRKNNKDTQVIEILCKYGCDPNYKSHLGETPLVIVIKGINKVYFDLEETIKILLKYGGDPYIKDNKGNNAFSYTSNSDIHKLLRGDK